MYKNGVHTTFSDVLRQLKFLARCGFLMFTVRELFQVTRKGMMN